jgi:Fur family peroxide stress response transcriptional regulator
MQQVEDLVHELRNNGGRVTPQRVAVLDAISVSNSHPTVDDVFDEVSKKQSSLSRKTVYKIVYDLAEIGAITLVDVGTGQVRIDPTVEYSHDHFVCSQCKCVTDIMRDEEPNVNRKVKFLGNVESVDVVYRGICKKCA